MHQKSKLVVYDDFADTFGRSRRDMHWSEIDELLHHFFQKHPKGSVADIGCGNGRLLKHILSHTVSTGEIIRYVGLDASRELIGQARSEGFDGAAFPLLWHEGDMRNIGTVLSDYGSFEAIFFIASFHHLATREERLSVLLQAKKLLSTTGEIYMINWNLTHPGQLKYENSKKAEYPDGSADFDIKIGSHQRFYHAFSHEEYESLAEEAGMKIADQFGERNSIIYFS